MASLQPDRAAIVRDIVLPTRIAKHPVTRRVAEPIDQSDFLGGLQFAVSDPIHHCGQSTMDFRPIDATAGAIHGECYDGAQAKTPRS